MALASGGLGLISSGIGSILRVLVEGFGSRLEFHRRGFRPRSKVFASRPEVVGFVRSSEVGLLCAHPEVSKFVRRRSIGGVVLIRRYRRPGVFGLFRPELGLSRPEAKSTGVRLIFANNLLRMINLPVRDTTIGIYSKIFDSSGVRILFSSFLLEVLKYFKVHISQLVPLDKLPINFNQNHVDQLKAHIVKLRDIPEGVLVRSRLNGVWCNLMCDPVLRCFDNTVMSIYDFLCMPSLDKAAVREEPHRLDTSILGRVADRTTSPTPAVTKADHPAKQKAFTRPEISTNAAKKTRSSKKGSEAGSSGLAVRDEVEQTDGGTLDDDYDQRNDLEFAMEDIGNLNDVNQDKEAEAHDELSGGVRRATRANFHASYGVSEDASSPAQEAVPAPDTQPLDADAGVDEIASDGFGSESHPYTKDDWEEIYRVNLGLRKKELYNDPKVYRTALDRFPTPAETHRLRELSLVELSDRMSVTEMGVLKSWCQTAEHKLSSWDKKHRKYRNERGILAMENEKIKEELVGTKLQLELHERQAEEVQGSIASFFQSDFTPLVRRFLKSGEFNRAFTGMLNTTISVRVGCGLRMDRTDEEFRELSQRVAGFIPDAKEKFDRVVAAFPDTTFPFMDKTFSATASLRANTYVQHSTSLFRTFGHTSTPEHLKKKKKSVEKGGPSAA
uniref:Transposase (Putative), gypsy type n=1 Tax=Tanacetum cinerariifolium TaxID=118510 RepID=A0A6L2NEC5_TANCI|nr:hypothetical protein [Tanacetum cinerariifolium]